MQTADGRRRSRWDEEAAEILGNRRTGPDWFTLELAAPRIAAGALPGQFVQVQVRADEGTPGCAGDPLLRRPLSLCTIDPALGRVSLLYRVVGRGTALLARARAGQRLNLLGPLGTSFPEPDPRAGRRLVLVGGGLGIPPLAGAAAWAAAHGLHASALLGARSQDQLAGARQVRAAGAAVAVATEDGSAGRRGLVTDALAEALAPDVDVWACGPGPMLAAVKAECARRGARAWLCVERPMACGFGVCIGCAIARAGGGGYLRACVDGPVFPADQVDVLG